MNGAGTRRAVLRLAAGTAGVVALPAWAGNANPSRRWRWSGVALGARASIIIEHPSRDEARRRVRACLAEVRRLERVFSLYRADSAIVALNRDGVLDAPPPELVEVLSLARSLHARTAGAFDVSVQPLWNVYHTHFAARPMPAELPERALRRALALVDAEAVTYDASRVRLGRLGMALTLNGIAQGYVADRVSAVLAAAGCDRALLDLGEVRTLGDGWRIGLPSTGDAVGVDGSRAVATSTPAGFAFDESGSHHHLFDPVSGRSASRYAAVTVLAPSAAVADGLSTACALLEPADAARLVASYEGVRVRLLGHDRATTWLGRRPGGARTE